MILIRGLFCRTIDQFGSVDNTSSYLDSMDLLKGHDVVFEFNCSADAGELV